MIGGMLGVEDGMMQTDHRPEHQALLSTFLAARHCKCKHIGAP